MKVSIWRQFSSNHSASFVIVGLCESPEKAEATARRLRGFLDELARWHVDHPEESEALWDNDAGVISEPERAAAEQYRIEWDYPVWWAASCTIDVFEQLVFVRNKSSVDSGAEPVDQLMRRFGAYEVFVSGDLIYIGDQRRLSAEVRAFAPDESVAKALVNELNATASEEESRHVRVVIDWEDFAISKGQKVIDTVSHMKRAGCAKVLVNFDESRGDSVWL